VPQFYLRYFSTPESRDTKNPKVWIFSKDSADGDEVLTSVRNVCGKRYLYSPTQLNGERNWELDERIEGLESLLGPIWPALAADFADLSNKSLRKGLALFVAAMHLRNPDVRNEVEFIHRQLVQFYATAPLLPDGTPNITSFASGGNVHEVDLSGWHEYRAWGKNDHDRFFADFIQSEAGRIAEFLLTKRWSVVLAERDTFITTDKPVSVQHQSKERFGIGTKGVIVTFPLSPTRLLVMDDMHDEPANQYYPLQLSNAGAFNCTIWHGASRFLITGRPITEVLMEICSAADGNFDA